MKIGIIGAGNIGATLARTLAASGHEVKLANSKEPDTIRDLARKVGATAVSKQDAVQGVEVIVVSIPFANYPDLADLFDECFVEAADRGSRWLRLPLAIW
jgi:predicted dinucleotide-binding enzyme